MDHLKDHSDYRLNKDRLVQSCFFEDSESVIAFRFLTILDQICSYRVDEK
jgi:hypothetical protein